MINNRDVPYVCWDVDGGRFELNGLHCFRFRQRVYSRYFDFPYLNYFY